MNTIGDPKTASAASTQPTADTTATARAQVVDVAIIGAGLAGSSIATVLGRTGRRVVLIDAHRLHPQEFRAEKLGLQHLRLFEKVGLKGAILPHITRVDENDVYRGGRLHQRLAQPEYGFAYSDLVNGLRSSLPPGVAFTVGKVASIDTSPDLQRVTLADGTAFEARLIVIATGLSEVVRRAVGARRAEISRTHSLSIGFNLALPADKCGFQSLTWYGRNAQDRIAYVTFFPIGGVMRANFFVYRQPSEVWTKEFRQNASAMLRQMMPEIAPLCGDFALNGPVEIRPIDLTQSEGHDRDGIVLVGDAFCTTCPVPGVGIQRVMTDVERLCSGHIQNWLATPGMSARKIASFYEDPIKSAMDASGMRSSLFARSMTVEVTTPWRFRRIRNRLARAMLRHVRWPRRGNVPAMG